MNHIDFSAFGSIDPTYDRGGDRIRWFCPWHVDEPVAAQRALAALVALESEVNASRITVRLISRGPLAQETRGILSRSGFTIEARMEFDSDQSGVITYVAKNLCARRSEAEDVRSEKALLERIMAKPCKGGAAIAAAFQQLENFRVEIVRPDSLSRTDILRLAVMHGEAFPTFPYDFRSKLALMLSSPENYLMCQVRSRKNNQIYAFSNLEINSVTLADGSNLRLAEYDNSMRATICPEHTELKGLGGIIRLRLARDAYRRGVELCHAESRASLAAINGLSYHLGMRFGGTLQKHLLISGQSTFNYRVPSQFESMNVWYLNRSDLAALAGA